MSRRTLWAVAAGFAVVALLILIVLTGAALAQASPQVAEVGATAVIVPWGDVIVAVAQTATSVLIPIVVAGVGVGLAKLFPWGSKLISTTLVERLVTNVADFGLNAVAGAAKGRTLPIPLGSAVIATAAQRAIDQASPALLEKAGGAPGIAEKVFRKLDLEAAATTANTLAPVLATLPAVVGGSPSDRAAGPSGV